VNNYTSEISKKLLTFHKNNDSFSDNCYDQLFELESDIVKESICILDLVDNYGPEHRTYQADTSYDLIRRLYKILTPFEPKSILDLGNGNGRVLFCGAHLFKKTEFHGIEMVSERVQYCRQLSQKMGLKINFLNGDATKIDLPKVESIILMNSLFPSLMPKLLKHLKYHAKANPFMLIAASTCNIIISDQDWLEEIQLSPPPINELDFRLFRTTI